MDHSTHITPVRHRAAHQKPASVVKTYHLPRSAHFDNYSPQTFGWGGHLDPTTKGNHDLIVDFEFKGVEFPGGIHRDFRNIAHNLLVDLYPEIPVAHRDKLRLVHGECGCFVNRNVVGSNFRSFHSWGLALDINWGENAMGTASKYGHPYVLPKKTGLIATRWGCEWGGDWHGRRDSMHIECHLSPHVARRVKMRNSRTFILL